MKTIRQIFMVLCMLNVLSGFAQTWNIGYPNAEDLTATLSGTTLTISGTGAMKDFSDFSGLRAPWYDSRGSVEFLL